MHELSSRRRWRLSAGSGKIAATVGACLCAGQLLVASPASANRAPAAAPAAVAPAAVAPMASAPAGAVTGIGAKAAARPIGYRVLAVAASLRGRPYRYGAAGPKAFDCSGLTQYVFRRFGRHLPHKANSQQRYGKRISRSKVRVGDLIFYRRGTYAYHVGIYAGGGYIYDSPRPGKRVGKHKIWARTYAIRRVLG